MRAYFFVSFARVERDLLALQANREALDPRYLIKTVKPDSKEPELNETTTVPLHKAEHLKLIVYHDFLARLILVHVDTLFTTTTHV